MLLRLFFFFTSEPQYSYKQGTLFFLSKDKVYKDIEAEIWPKIKDILRTKPSLRFAKKKIYIII